MSAPPVTHRLIIPYPRGDAVLVEADGRLPWISSEDRHTAEVDYINAAVRECWGVSTTVLCSLRHDVQTTGAVNRVHVLEVHGEPPRPRGGERWLDRGGLHGDEAALVAEWEAIRAAPVVNGRGWTRPGWFRDVCDWIASTLRRTDHGAPIDIVQVRAWPSSCVLRVRTPEGDLYFKAVATSGRRECAVTEYLAARFATAVPTLLAHDAERRWLLMRASPGAKLEEIADVAAWERAARMYGRLQVDCIAHARPLRALGCPERSLDALEQAISDGVVDDAARRGGGADGLSTSEAAQLRAALAELRRRCVALRAVPPPLTLEHGDLWPGNFLVAEAECVLIDWEDVAIGHPFLSLAPLLVGLAIYQPALNTPATRQRVERAYLEAFAGIAAADVFESSLRLAAPLSFVDMAIRYRRQPPSVVRLHPWMHDLVPQSLRLALAQLE